MIFLYIDLYGNSCCCFFPFCHLHATYVSLIVTLLLLLLSLFINITVTGIFEKSSGVEFLVRNSSSMVYPYSSQ